MCFRSKARQAESRSLHKRRMQYKPLRPSPQFSSMTVSPPFLQISTFATHSFRIPSLNILEITILTMKRSRNFESAAYAGRARLSREGSRRARRTPRGWNNWHRSTSPRHLSSTDERCSRETSVGVEARDDAARRRHRTLTVWRLRRRPTSHIW